MVWVEEKDWGFGLGFFFFCCGLVVVVVVVADGGGGCGWLLWMFLLFF